MGRFVSRSLACLALLLSLTFSYAVEPRPREVWLTSGTTTYVITQPKATLRGTLDVGEEPTAVRYSPDRTLVAVAARGPTEPYFTIGGITETWPRKQVNKSKLTLVRNQDMKVLVQVDVPFYPAWLAFNRDGSRLAVLSLGQMSKNKSKQILPQLTVLDTTKGTILLQRQLTSMPMPYWQTRGDLLLVPLLGFLPSNPPVAPELAVIDMTALTVETVPLPSNPMEWHDNGNPQSRFLGMTKHVQLVSAEGKLVGQPLQMGSERALFVRVQDTPHFLLGGRTGKEGKLAFVREDGKMDDPVAVPPPEAVLYDAGGKRFVVCGNKKVAVLEAGSLKQLGLFDIPGAHNELMLDPGGKRLFVNMVGDNVAAYDLATFQQAGKFTSGRGGIKFAQALAVALAQGLSMAQYQMIGVPGMGMGLTMPSAVQSLAFSPSGNYVYVYNSQTADITVAETVTFTTPRKVATAGYPKMWRTPDGSNLLSVSFNKLLIFDTEKGDLLLERQFPKASIHYDPSQGMLFVLNKEASEAYRLFPFEKASDLPGYQRMSFLPKVELILFTANKTAVLYGYNLEKLRELPDTTPVLWTTYPEDSDQQPTLKE